MHVTRRGFLKKGIFGGALLLLGGAGFLVLRSGRRRPVPAGLRVLDEVDHAVLMAVADRLLPAREGFPTPDEVGLGLTMDRFLVRAPADAVKELRQLLRLFENGLSNFLFGARTRPFTALGPREQDEVLAEWARSKLLLRRSGFVALRSLVGAAYFGTREVWKAVGYPGPPAGLAAPDVPAWKGPPDVRVGLGVFSEPPAPGDVADGGTP